MNVFRFLVFSIVLSISGLTIAAHRPHGGMMRAPDVSSTHIVFVYAEQLWVVPIEGGVASPLANPAGGIGNPRFSPKGDVVAFSANYDGDTDLYRIDLPAGIPVRLSHHPANELLSDWSPDGKGVLFTSFGLGEHPRTTQVFSVSVDGGLPEMLPVPYGAHPTLSSDGQWLAYTPYARDHRTWKRYRGGMASDVWLFNLKTNQSEKITEWEGTDSFPMWHGSKVFYLSDGGDAHKLNIWSYDTKTKTRNQVTHFKDYDVKAPSIGPNHLVFQNGSSLHLLDLGTLETKAVDIQIPGDRTQLKEKLVDAGSQIRSGGVSATGQRVVFGARGDLWSLPAKNGSPRNLTLSDSVHERSPVWSPDKEWIAFFSDKAGSYDLYQIKADGSSKEPERLTQLKARFLYNNQWSPDSRYVSFWTRGGELYLFDREEKVLTKVDTDLLLQRETGNFSHDSRFLVYCKGGKEGTNQAIYIYDIEGKSIKPVTTDFFNHSNPVFDREGKYLFFTSNRFFESPQYEDLGTTWIYAQTQKIYALTLGDEVAAPFAPTSDEEVIEEEKAEKDSENDKGKKDKSKDGEEKETKFEIDFNAMTRRAVALPIKPGNYRNLAVNDKGNLLFLQRTPGEPAGTIKILDLGDEKKKAKKVLDGVNAFDITADGKKLLVAASEKFAIVKASAGQKMKDQISTKGMKTLVNPRNEWNQIFDEVWRFYRDLFYDPTLHNVDWDHVYKQYKPMLEDCVSRSDLSFVIRELISEMNVGHAYYRPSPEEMGGPRMNVGLLGVNWELDQDTYRIASFIEGGPWDEDARGPLSQPGVNVQVGDYILSVNGRELDPAKDPWASFVGMAGQTVTLKVAKDREGKDARDVVVKLLSSERRLKFRSWVQKNWDYVNEKTNGQVGYIYVPDTGVNGQNELVRQFYGQIGKKALIIDERWNGGGQIPTRFVELLNRPPANYWALRDGRDWPWPPDSHFGPKCMLINGLAGSGGDYFPFWFREAGVGKLIGTRTWGGLVGISREPALLDGAGVSIPSFAFYENDGTWGIEGHGVDPDIEVVDDPALMIDGGDPQLDRAIEEMLNEIKTNPYQKPKRPPYPKRDKMGIEEQNK